MTYDVSKERKGERQREREREQEIQAHQEVVQVRVIARNIGIAMVSHTVL